MKMMKKIALLTVLVSQAPALNCAPRACGCQRPPQPQPQPIAQSVVKQDVSMDLLIEECCTMLMDEAQKLNNNCLAEEITEMVALVKTQEARKCACMKPKPQPQPQQQPQVQAPVQAQAPEAQEILPVEPAPEISSRVLLSECCSALLDEAKNRNDQESIGRIDMIMEKVTMIPCTTK